MQGDLAVERRCGQDAGRRLAPLNVEIPVRARGKLGNDLTGLGVPAKRPVVLAAREQQGRILQVPGHGEHAFGMGDEFARRRDRVPQIPHLKRARAIVVARDDKLGRHLWVPLQRRAPPAGIRIGERNHRTLTLQIPNHRGTVERRRRQNVLHFMIPRQIRNLPGARAARGRLERGIQRRLVRICQIPNTKLPILRPAREQVG